MKRTISAMRGPGSLKHNRRAFTAANVDAERTRYNVVYKDEPIKQVYHKLFDDSLKKYNQSRNAKTAASPITTNTCEPVSKRKFSMS